MTISDLQAHLPMMSFSNDIKQLRIDKNSMLFMLPPRIRDPKTSPHRQLILPADFYTFSLILSSENFAVHQDKLVFPIFVTCLLNMVLVLQGEFKSGYFCLASAC